MKEIFKYAIGVSLVHCGVILVLANNYDHGDVFIWCFFYALVMAVLALVLIFVFKRKTFGAGILLSLALPIILFLIIQLFVMLSYWKK